MKKITYSFAQLCRDSNNEKYIEYWDYDKNKLTPEDFQSGSNKYAFWKCPRGLHGSREVLISAVSKYISDGKDYPICKQCNSIGQKIIDDYGIDYLNSIWSSKNEKSYYEISAGSNNRIFLRCLENKEHPDYDLNASNFSHSHNCPYCAGKRVCFENSIANHCPDIIDVWSDKNKKTPYDYTYGSGQDVWLKCEKGIHEDYKRSVCNIMVYGCHCKKCNHEENRHYEDLTGMRFGRLTVVAPDKESFGDKNGMRWLCDCECGTKGKSILACHLKAGNIVSCGCFWRESITGENNKNWKGGVRTEREIIRTSSEYQNWRKDVLRYDNFKCVICGSNSKLEAHHIHPFADFKELIFCQWNGITMCKNHHNKDIVESFHKIYGTKDNTPEQLQEYINKERKKYGNNEPFNIYEYMNNKKYVGIMTDRF